MTEEEEEEEEAAAEEEDDEDEEEEGVKQSMGVPSVYLSAVSPGAVCRDSTCRPSSVLLRP